LATLANFEKTTSKTFLSAGKNLLAKAAVRELDEESEGVFVAFVDEGKESYDVRIVFDQKEIASTQCDCAEEYAMCSHKIAVLLKLKEPSEVKAKVKKVKAKKETPSQVLLRTSSHEALIQFLQNSFAEDKLFEQKFINTMLLASDSLTQDQVWNLIEKTIKAAVKSKKRLDYKELTKLIQVTQPILKAQLNAVQGNLTQDNLIDIILLHRKYIQRLDEYDYQSHYTMLLSNNFFESIAKCILLQSENFIKNDAIKVLMNCLNADTHIFHKDVVLIFEKILLDSEEDVIDLYIQAIKQKVSTQNNLPTFVALDMHDMFLQLLSRKNLFAKYSNYFGAVRYKPTYNTALINQLIVIEDYATAENICNTCIAENVKADYNFAFFLLLKKIYAATYQSDKLIETLNKTLPITYDSADYAMLMNLLKDDLLKKEISTKLIKKAQGHRAYYAKAEIFLFDIFAQNKNYEKIFEHASKHFYPQNIIPYFDILKELKGDLFLQMLLNYSDRNTYTDESYKETKLNIVLMANKIIENFSKEEILNCIHVIYKKSGNYFSSIGILSAVENLLKL
jgi:hypothetical protein